MFYNYKNNKVTNDLCPKYITKIVFLPSKTFKTREQSDKYSVYFNIYQKRPHELYIRNVIKIIYGFLIIILTISLNQ